MATQICILTAFSVVPQNFLILRCCFSHLKNSSICQRFLQSSATNEEEICVAFVRNANSLPCSSSKKRTSRSCLGQSFVALYSVNSMIQSESTFLGSRRFHFTTLYCTFFFYLLIRCASKYLCDLPTKDIKHTSVYYYKVLLFFA